MGKLKHWVPIFTVEDATAAGEFYCATLGFEKDWEHRFADDFPLYVSISRDGLSLHLSEHGTVRNTSTCRAQGWRPSQTRFLRVLYARAPTGSRTDVPIRCASYATSCVLR